ncbi:MAG TPA: lipopolysaccharide core heptose(I) kinase RfaP [Methylophilaceae bacterium]|nr:lipopolysaccharide core heptose(I) kinase RfaP [Methylophilaceae bacterium]
MGCNKKTIFSMPAPLRKALGVGKKSDTFEVAMALDGQTFRDVPGRKTMRVEILEKSYFIKQHFGVGWAEIVKNLCSLKKPILSAMTEVAAIEKIQALNVATTPLVAYGQRGCNPAKLQSFVMTEDLGDITSLEDLCASWKQEPPDPRFKRQLIIQAAILAKTLHDNGVNHRDFYLCHLCLDNASLPKIKLILIDLHRVIIHRVVNEKANMKDIAALYFSSMDVGLTARDYVRFKHYYQSHSVDFWQRVESRAKRLYKKFNSKKFQKKLALERTKLD